MKRKISILIILFLPAILFGQTNLDSIMRATPRPAGNLTWLCSASYVVMDSTTVAVNQLKFYQDLNVKRDTSKLVTIDRDTIKQDGKVIGWYKFIIGGRGCEIYGGKGYAITNANFPDERTYAIQSFKDNSKHTIKGTDFYELEIAEYLVKHGYL